MTASRSATIVESDGQVVTGRNVAVAEVISTARHLLVIPSEVERAAKSRDEREILGALEQLGQMPREGCSW